MRKGRKYVSSGGKAKKIPIRDSLERLLSVLQTSTSPNPEAEGKVEQGIRELKRRRENVSYYQEILEDYQARTRALIL